MSTVAIIQIKWGKQVAVTYNMEKKEGISMLGKRTLFSNWHHEISSVCIHCKHIKLARTVPKKANCMATLILLQVPPQNSPYFYWNLVQAEHPCTASTHSALCCLLEWSLVDSVSVWLWQARLITSRPVRWHFMRQLPWVWRPIPTISVITKKQRSHKYCLNKWKALQVKDIEAANV